MLIFFSSGCSPVDMATVGTPIAGVTYYLTGEAEASYPVSIAHLYEVVLYSFEQEGTELISVTNTEIDAQFLGKTYDGKDIRINIYYNDEGMGTIGVRFGVFGNEKRSRELIKRMESLI